jgi:alpha-beta hydrolase superfamily lysophospholipase
VRVLLLCVLALGRVFTAFADEPRLPERITVQAGDQRLAVWFRQPQHPRGAVVLVHGLTFSARTAFDFKSRAADRSLLTALAASGLAAYGVDLPGYGSSPRASTGWLEPDRAAEDVEAVVRVVSQRHARLPAPVLLGWSRGSKISALVATRGREAISALVLYGFNFDPAASPDHGPAAGPAPSVPNTPEWARSDFVSPEVVRPELVHDFVAAALTNDPVRAPVCCDVQFRAIRPAAIHVPTLLLHGARDPALRPAVAAAFFAQLGSAERRWIIVGAGDHAAHLEDTAPEVISAIIDFLRAAVPVQ